MSSTCKFNFGHFFLLWFFSEAGLCEVTYGYLLFEANLPRRIEQTCLAPAALMCGHIFSESESSLPVAFTVPDDPQITPATRRCISFPMSLGWLTNTGYSHMLLLLFLIHYTAHMSRFASSCSLNKQKRHSTAFAKSLWTKLLPLAHHGFNYVLENIKQVGQFVVGNHISIERAQDITNDL